MKTSTYFLAEGGFVVLTIVSFYLLIRIFREGLAKAGYKEQAINTTLRMIVLALAGWGVLVTVLSLTGFIKDFSSFPPKMMILLIIPLVAVIWFTRTDTLKTIILNTPIEKLTRLQSFRFFVELLLWWLFVDNLLPIQMTFEGWNFDVLSGITAPLAAYGFRKNKTVMIIWNIACLLLLVNILTIAVLSMPTPMRVFMNEPANTIVASFPIVLLPAFLVPLAYTLHFFSLRKLLMS